MKFPDDTPRTVTVVDRVHHLVEWKGRSVVRSDRGEEIKNYSLSNVRLIKVRSSDSTCNTPTTGAQERKTEERT